MPIRSRMFDARAAPSLIRMVPSKLLKYMDLHTIVGCCSQVLRLGLGRPVVSRKFDKSRDSRRRWVISPSPSLELWIIPQRRGAENRRLRPAFRPT